VVVERRELDDRWQRFAWKPVAVIPGAPPITLWREFARGERFVGWHAATLMGCTIPAPSEGPTKFSLGG